MRTRLLWGFVIALLAGAPAVAQPVEDPPVDARKLDRVRVELLDSDPPIRGRFLGLTSESVTVLKDDRRIEVPLARVRSVDRGGDPVYDGALWTGTLLAVWCAFVCGQGLDSADQVPSTVFWVFVEGAVIGGVVDSFNTDRHTIYRAPGARPATQHQRRPALSVTFRF